MNTDRNNQAHPPARAPASTPGPGRPAAPARPADEDEYAAIAAGEPEGQIGPAIFAPGDPEAPVGPSVPAPGGADGPVGAAVPAPGGAEAPDAEAQVQVDLDALTAKAEKADEYLKLAQRTKADFENYRKRALRDAAAAQDRGIAKLAMELLPAVDNLDRALDAAEASVGTDGGADDNGGSPLVSGIRLVHADVISALARVGIEPFSPKGEKFDPQHHEAIAQQPVDGAASGTVVEVYQRGYRLGESVLRPARVVVAE